MKLSLLTALEIFENPRQLQFVVGGDYTLGFALFVNRGNRQIFTSGPRFKTKGNLVGDLCLTFQEILKQGSVLHPTVSDPHRATSPGPERLSAELVEWTIERLRCDDVVNTHEAPAPL